MGQTRRKKEKEKEKKENKKIEKRSSALFIKDLDNTTPIEFYSSLN